MIDFRKMDTILKGKGEKSVCFKAEFFMYLHFITASEAECKLYTPYFSLGMQGFVTCFKLWKNI